MSDLLGPVMSREQFYEHAETFADMCDGLTHELADRLVETVLGCESYGIDVIRLNRFLDVLPHLPEVVGPDRAARLNIADGEYVARSMIAIAESEGRPEYRSRKT